MMDVKEAVKTAVDYFSELYGQQEDVMLEEVALSDDEKLWYVTLGFSRPIHLKDSLGFSLPLASAAEQPLKPVKCERVYKILEIDSATGKVRSMKIRAA